MNDLDMLVVCAGCLETMPARRITMHTQVCSKPDRYRCDRCRHAEEPCLACWREQCFDELTLDAMPR
jgi:hypothetical protein